MSEKERRLDPFSITRELRTSSAAYRYYSLRSLADELGWTSYIFPLRSGY